MTYFWQDPEKPLRSAAQVQSGLARLAVERLERIEELERLLDRAMFHNTNDDAIARSLLAGTVWERRDG